MKEAPGSTHLALSWDWDAFQSNSNTNAIGIGNDCFIFDEMSIASDGNVPLISLDQTICLHRAMRALCLKHDCQIIEDWPP